LTACLHLQSWPADAYYPGKGLRRLPHALKMLPLPPLRQIIFHG
jgi:hypothetical protein